MSNSEKKENKAKIIKDAVILWDNLSRPTLIKNGVECPEQPLKDKRWKVEILISKAEYKKIKPYCKGASSTVFEELDDSEIKEKYKIDNPFDGEAYKVSFGKTCMSKAGRVLDKPKTVGVKRAKKGDSVTYKDSEGNLIEGDTTLGRGTKGHIAISSFENMHGKFISLEAFCVTELVEYVPNKPDVEFDFEDDDFEDEETNEGFDFDDEE